MPAGAAKSAPHRALTEPYDFSSPSARMAGSCTQGPYTASLMASEPRPRPKLVERLQERRADHVRRGLVYRITFGVAGLIVLLAGLVLLVTPGPAFVFIPIGLAMLSLEFAWAERALEKALVQADLAKEKAARASRTQKVLGVFATAAGIAAFVVAVLMFDVPVLPDN